MTAPISDPGNRLPLSPQLARGLERLVRYHRILHDAAVVQLRVEKSAVRLTHALPSNAVRLPRHTAEFIVAGWLVVARQATGLHLTPVEVSFRHPALADLTEHRRLFGAPVRFDRPMNGIVLRRDSLDTPLVKADSGLGAILERHVRDLVERMPKAATFSERIRQLVALMEVRHAPVVLCRLTDLWVVLTGVSLLGSYLVGMALPTG